MRDKLRRFASKSWRDQWSAVKATLKALMPVDRGNRTAGLSRQVGGLRGDAPVFRVSVPNRLRDHFLDATLRRMAHSFDKSFSYNDVLKNGEFAFGKFHVRFAVRPDTFDANITPKEAYTPAEATLVETYLRRFFDIEYRPYPCKIFGIGLPRTGTTSLTAALKRLGIFTLHYAPWMAAGIANKIYRCETTDDFDAMTDSPFPLIYREMDLIYPRSKFILTLRDVDEWLPSSRFLKGDSLLAYRRMYYGIDGYREDVYRARFIRHRDEVIDYFSGRPDDLLVFDFSNGAGWPRLCSFLNLPEPEGSFPWVNRRVASPPNVVTK